MLMLEAAYLSTLHARSAVGDDTESHGSITSDAAVPVFLLDALLVDVHPVNTHPPIPLWPFLACASSSVGVVEIAPLHRESFRLFTSVSLFDDIPEALELNLHRVGDLCALVNIRQARGTTEAR